MDPAAIGLATAAGVAAGWFAGPAADAIAAPRYAPGAPGHDPDDLALAPLAAPTSTRTRGIAALLGGAGAAAVAARFDDGGLVALLVTMLAVYLAASIVDLQYLRLPDAVTYPAAVVALGGSYLVARRAGVTDAAQGALVGAVAFAGFLLVFALGFELIRGKAGMGMGDVKLALSLGALVGLLGWRSDLTVLGPVRLVVYAALFGNIAGVVGGLAITRFRPGRGFPFGPFLVLGWLVAVWISPSLS